METGIVSITIHNNGGVPSTMRFRSIENMATEMVVYELSKEIMAAKQIFLNAVKEYTDGIIATAAIVPGLTRTEQRKRNFHMRNAQRIYNEYKNLLNGFIIINTMRVNYNGEEYVQDEPVRRLTKNHLAFMEEIKSEIKDVPAAMKAYKAYKELVEDFLGYVKYEI